MAEGRFELRAVGPYSFGASVRFLEGFAPAAYGGDRSGHLHLAFVADGGEEVAGVYVREERGVILGEVSGGAEVEVVRRQVERIHIARRGREGVPRDRRAGPCCGKVTGAVSGAEARMFLLAVRGGGVGANRAAHQNRPGGEDQGPHGQGAGSFRRGPRPQRVRLPRTREVGGARRLPRAQFTQGGVSAPPGQGGLGRKTRCGLSQISTRGRGAWAVGGAVWHRPLLGRAHPVTRGGRAVAMAYGLDEPPSAQELEQLGLRWRPYRTWVTLHLRAMLEDETREIRN